MDPLDVLEPFLMFLSHIDVVLEPFLNSRIGISMMNILDIVLFRGRLTVQIRRSVGNC